MPTPWLPGSKGIFTTIATDKLFWVIVQELTRTRSHSPAQDQQGMCVAETYREQQVFERGFGLPLQLSRLSLEPLCVRS